jgi:hypothetical protein
LQPFHALAEVRLGEFDREVEMIAHDDIRVNAPAEALRRLSQGSNKSFGGTLAVKQGAPVVAAIDHVVTGTGKFNAERAGHGGEAGGGEPGLSRVKT